VRSVVAVALVAIVAAGCGSEAANESEETVAREQPRAAETEPSEPSRAGSFSLVIAGDGTKDRRPVTEWYSVFSRPGTARDRAVAEEVAQFAEPEGGCGAPISARARLLLSGIGAQHYDLVAVPTSTGFVAYGLLPTGGGGCGRPFRGLVLAGEIDSDVVLHYGLVPDDVESVEVVLKGRAHEARMGDNAFAVEVKGASEKDGGQVVVHRRDGTTQTFP
jgi:hypothetical protein